VVEEEEEVLQVVGEVELITQLLVLIKGVLIQDVIPQDKLKHLMKHLNTQVIMP
jgi:hypothetical protein